MDSASVVGAGDPSQYQQGWSRVTEGDQDRRDTVLEFIKVSQDYLDNWGVVRMLQAWRELGYTHNLEDRIKAHAGQVSSNYLMVLMESISTRYFNSKWVNRGQLIFDCFDRSHAPIMEVAFTAISGAKVTSGHGMSHHPAGLSVASNYKERSVSTWEVWEADALPMMGQNMAIEMSRLSDRERQAKMLEEDAELFVEALEQRKLQEEMDLYKPAVALASVHQEIRSIVPPRAGQYSAQQTVPDSDEEMSEDN